MSGVAKVFIGELVEEGEEKIILDRVLNYKEVLIKYIYIISIYIYIFTLYTYIY